MIDYEAIVRKCKPQPGDFFLTASSTAANRDVRELSGSRYGHAIIFTGPVEPATYPSPTGKEITIPGARYDLGAFELPIHWNSLPNILRTDGCFQLMHVHCTALSAADRKRITDLCVSFTVAKYAGVKTDGYSNRMAIGYALVDAWGKKVGGLVIPEEYNPTYHVARNATKVLNALVQSAVELDSGYPNLNCSSLIAWLYKQAGHTITHFATTTSPRDLYGTVTGDRRFVSREFDFRVRPGQPNDIVETRPGREHARFGHIPI